MQKLVKSQFGNYVVQCVYERGRPSDRRRIVQYCAKHVSKLACHKYGSNVLEKILACGGPDGVGAAAPREEADRSDGPSVEGNGANPDAQEQRRGPRRTGHPQSGSQQCDRHAIVQRILDQNLLISLTTDKFGNYIVQDMLGLCEGEQLGRIVAQLKEFQPQLRKYSYGRYIVLKLRALEQKAAAGGGAAAVLPGWAVEHKSEEEDAATGTASGGAVGPTGGGTTGGRSSGRQGGGRQQVSYRGGGGHRGDGGAGVGGTTSQGVAPSSSRGGGGGPASRGQRNKGTANRSDSASASSKSSSASSGRRP